MVHHQQHHHGSNGHRKQNSGDLNHLLPLVNPQYSAYNYRKTTLLRLFLLFSIFSFVATALFLLPSSPYYSLLDEEELEAHSQELPCSSMSNNSVCCDRSARRSDVCFVKGQVSTHSPSNTFFLFSNSTTSEDRIRPYTRKWEENTMSTIDEVRIVTSNRTSRCDVQHDVPAVVFSTGGYTGNVYHEFNDGIVPLYITSHQFNKKVVFVILEYHDWWISKYENILSQLSDYPPIDFANDKRVHCFKEAIVGLKIHDELTVDAAKMSNNKTIRDFRNMLDEAYKPRIQDIVEEEKKSSKMEVQVQSRTNKPKLVIVSRNGSRGIENEGELVKLAEEIGFNVEVLRPQRTTELAKIYRSLNSSDMMIGVHGAAMTHLLFMRPGSVFIQVVPLGTDWAAESYYGEPATKLGLKYVRYKISPKESSLYREYKKDDLVLTDPESVNARGWEVTKKVYLDGQNVRLDLERFRKRLARAHQYLVGKSRKTL